MSLLDSSGSGRFWTVRRSLMAGSAARVVVAGTTVALTVGQPAAQHAGTKGSSTARLAASTCTGPAGAAYVALAGYQSFDAIETVNCAYVQNYNVGDPAVPGDPGEVNYASSVQGIAIHGDTLYFADTGNDMVSIVDTATLDPKNYNPAETDIHVGINPDDLAVSPDGSQLWVADTGPQTGPGSPTDIKVISTATDKVTATLPLPSAPAQIEFSPSGATAYVTTAAGLWIFGTANDRVTGVIHGLGDPHGIAVSPDGSTVYVANPDSNTVSVVSTKTGKVTSTISLAGGPDVLALTPDGSQLWVTGITSGILTVLNAANGSVVGTVNLGGDGANSGDGMDPAGIVVTSHPTPD